MQVWKILGSGVVLGTAAIAGQPAPLLAQTAPTIAANPAATEVNRVTVTPTATGISLSLSTTGTQAPQAFSTNLDKVWVTDLIGARLNLPEGKSFSQPSPAPGIASIAVSQVSENGVRIVVTGSDRPPLVTNSSRNGGSLQFELSTQASAAPVLSPSAPPIGSAPRPSLRPPAPPQRTAQATSPAPIPVSPALQPPGQPLDPRQQLQPTPSPLPGQLPPLQPRAVAPPLGDIAISNTVPQGTAITFPNARPVPRIALRNASAREVLSIIAQSAGLNLVYLDSGEPSATGNPLATPSTNPSGGNSASSNEPRVSVDLQNIDAQSAFNYVLQIAGLQASRQNNVILVGRRLPPGAGGLVSRTFRLNQAVAQNVAGYLTTLGANSVVSFTKKVCVQAGTSDVAPVPGGTPGQIQTLSQGTAQCFDEPEIKELKVPGTPAGPLPLKNISITADIRTNSLSIVGDPQSVNFATSLIQQLDLRKRQASVNVKVIDLDLNDLNAIASSFSFGVGNTLVSGSGGLRTTVIDNAGSVIQPPNDSVFNPSNLPAGINPANPLAVLPNQLPNSFLGAISASIINNKTKLLTDPTLIIQEGEKSEVKLTSQVIQKIESETTTNGSGPPTVSRTIDLADVGLQLTINVERIDDNGFITLTVLPAISSPQDVVTFGDPNTSGVLTTLIKKREVSSGKIRLRDDQTLILSGIIQDEERERVAKIPLLGDIPLIGSLFRTSYTDRQRREVVVVITPKILADTDATVFGYGYQPSPPAQSVLNNTLQTPTVAPLP
ncbi:secretin N-terminal domain-containing protein [Synechococcus elongatus]|uniref:Secretin N-terminal domain-containing protein n=1 Tax=Synechococcus elongatus PCC 11801 TaxID=2219813 RepID=A0AAN1QQN2_SYNEL|nr:secretin N-terminal domain-containing protein [Synechococcus elongatus]